MLESQLKDHSFLVDQKTKDKIQAQLSIIKSVLKSVSAVFEVPELLMYEISKYVFSNPLSLKQMLFSPCSHEKLQLNKQYLLLKKDSTSQENPRMSEQNVKQSGRQSGYLTVTQQWKGIKLSEGQNYNQILQKGTLFLAFLSNIKLRPLDYQPEEQQLFSFNTHNYEKKQKEKLKYFRLLSAYPEQTFQYFSEVYNYKKDKKLTQLVIKAFSCLMSKAIITVKVERNYNNEQIGCEDRFLIVEGAKPISIAIRKDDIRKKVLPVLQCIQGTWKITSEEKTGFDLYREIEYPLGRDQKTLLTRNLEEVHQHDVWISF